jgi:hypothetical protein
MRPPSQSTINDLLAALNELHSKKEVLSKQIDAVQATIDFFSSTGSTPTLVISDPDSVVESNNRRATNKGGGLLKLMPMHRWADELDGLTQFGALVRIAQLNNGEVRPSEAAGVLVAAGYGKGKPRNLSSGLYALLARSEIFERIGPGTFRLLPGTASLDGTLWSDQTGNNLTTLETRTQND